MEKLQPVSRIVCHGIGWHQPGQNGPRRQTGSCCSNEWMRLTGAGWQLVKRWRSLGVDQQGAQVLTIAIDRIEE